MHCVDCGRPFVQIGGRGRPRVRCSECSPEQKKPTGSYVGLNINYRPRETACAHCGVPFAALYERTTHCCDQCRTDAGNQRQYRRLADASAAWRGTSRECRQCGEAFAVLHKHQVFCGPDCAARAHNARPERLGRAHVRRALHFGCRIEAVNKLRVFERDGWRCRLCGVDAPRELMGTVSGNAPELDHDVPLSRGGAHSYANTQLLCSCCNRQKGDRTTDEMRQLVAA